MGNEKEALHGKEVHPANTIHGITGNERVSETKGKEVKTASEGTPLKTSTAKVGDGAYTKDKNGNEVPFTPGKAKFTPGTKATPSYSGSDKKKKSL